ncbi:Nacht and ankyrin domain protein [Fusarium austroafricanum]|uniref:Nacht and ankyrin domain protein n=1 Tax=Fusarium austroafricanum TaxID=2364996 RepID=A0A8H4NU80_9HYPO|nr:Nacht and ankyrin domain protein [Fusarium austroafricanum]
MLAQNSIQALMPVSPTELASGGNGQVYASLFVLACFIPLVLPVLNRYRNPDQHPQRKRPINANGRLPFIGHALALIAYPESFLLQLLNKLCLAPIQVLLPTGGFYLVSPGDQAMWLLKSGRQTVPTPSLLYAFQTFFGLHREDLKVFEHNNISVAEARLGFSTSHQDPSRRIMEHQRRDFRLYLHGPSLNSIINRFLGILRHEMFQRTAIRNDWVDVPDLYTFVVTKVFRSEVEAIYGKHMFTACPSLEEDFWRFYDSFPRISLGLPWWLSASSYRARDRMLENFRLWRMSCQNTRRLNDPTVQKSEYDPVWGSQSTQRMLRRFLDLGLTEDGIDTAMFGFFYVTFANTIPVVAWMMLHIHMSDGIANRVRAELSRSVLDKSGFVKLDDLAHQPLLNSIYYETLRLQVASTVGRKSPTDIHAPGGWEFGADLPMLVPSWLGGLDNSFWNTGGTLPGGDSQHPVDRFWAERFLEYPNDPLSGPMRKEHSTHQTPAAKVPSRSESDDYGAKLVTKGTQGHFFPFGGGVSKCPGEALAGQTILSSVVFMLYNFDIQLCAPNEAKKIRSQHRTLPFGSHAFDQPVPIRIRRRVLP